MFPIGVLLLFAGYALAYTGAANLLNAGQGPRLTEALGLAPVLAPAGASVAGASAIGAGTPNLMGQPPSSNPAPTSPNTNPYTGH